MTGASLYRLLAGLIVISPFVYFTYSEIKSRKKSINMGRSQKKRLLAALERFRRNYIVIPTGHNVVLVDGTSLTGVHIMKRILNHKEHGSK